MENRIEFYNLRLGSPSGTDYYDPRAGLRPVNSSHACNLGSLYAKAGLAILIISTATALGAICHKQMHQTWVGIENYRDEVVAQKNSTTGIATSQNLGNNNEVVFASLTRSPSSQPIIYER